MNKTSLEQFNDKSKDLQFWIKQYLLKKIYTLKLDRGFTADKNKVNESTRYFNREQHYELVNDSKTIEELRTNCNKVALSISGIRNYSSPLISFYNSVMKDKKINTLKKIDTNYINTYTKLNNLSSNYYVQIKSLFKFIDENIIDNFKFNIGYIKDGTKAKLPIKMVKEKTYNYLEPSDFAKFVGSIKNYKSNHPNPFLLKLMVKFFCFGGLRAEEAQYIKIADISFKEIQKEQYMQLRILGKGNKKRFVYILFALLKDDYEKYLKIKKEKEHKCDYLFYSRDYKMFSDKRIYDIIKDFHIKSKLKIKNFSTHSLRRSMATFLHFKGVKSEIVSEILGHNDEESIEYYIFATQEERKKVPNLLEFI